MVPLVSCVVNDSENVFDEIRSNPLKKKQREFESLKEQRGGMCENLKQSQKLVWKGWWGQLSGRFVISPSPGTQSLSSSGKREEEKFCSKEQWTCLGNDERETRGRELNQSCPVDDPGKTYLALLFSQGSWMVLLY